MFRNSKPSAVAALCATTALILLGCETNNTTSSTARNDTAMGMTSDSPSAATTTAAAHSVALADQSLQKPGFVVYEEDGRLWIFQKDSPGLAEYLKSGEPAKSVTRPGAGPRGMTVRSVDAETIDAYLVARPGFQTFVKEGRVWVFRDGDANLEEFKRTGEPAKSITRPGAGPRGMTIRSVDAETINAYLAAAEAESLSVEDAHTWTLRRN